MRHQLPDAGCATASEKIGFQDQPALALKLLERIQPLVQSIVGAPLLTESASSQPSQ